MSKTDIVYVTTGDSLRLPGVIYEPESPTDVCLLMVHGMSGNILENFSFNYLGKAAASAGIAAVYSHNRGYNHRNDIPLLSSISADNGYKTLICGASYERFADSEKDLDIWIDFVRGRGYRKIFLLGHSLGAPKVVSYMSKFQPNDVVGIILASPPDMVGLGSLPVYQSNYPQLLSEAKNLVETGHPTQLLSGKIWDYYDLSAQTFLDLFTPGGPADIFPVHENPQVFPALSSISQPILCLMGEHDDIVIRSVGEDMELIKSKALKSKSFSTAIIPGADHVYNRREKELADTILGWINQLGV